MESTVERAARRHRLDLLSSTANQLFESVSKAVNAAPDTSVAGWRILRVPVPMVGDFEIRVAESTRAHVPITIDAGNAAETQVIVTQGALSVSYDGLEQLLVSAGERILLPEGITRTTFAAEHPTTVFCVLLGRRVYRDRSAMDPRSHF